MIKKIQRGLVIFCALLLCSQVGLAKSNEQSLDRIVVVVNDAVITQSELDKAIKTVRTQLIGTNMPVPPPSALQKQVLEQIINRKLQLQAATLAGVRVKDEQLDKAIASIASGNGVSVDELYRRVTAQGLSKTDYRKEIREEITLQQIAQQEAGSKLMVSPEEVKNFMRAKSWKTPATTAPKEYYVEDLLVLLPDGAKPADIATLKTQADALLAKARQGASYKDIASAEANNKAVEQNDLGWRKLDDLPSAFAKPISDMKKGTIIGPIQTANGFHILRLVDIRQPTATNTANSAIPTEKQAEQMIYQQKMDASVKKWVARLRTQAVINMHPEG